MPSAVLAGIIAHSKKLGLALGLAGVCLFGGTLPATRLTAASIDPLFLTAARAALAGCAGAVLLLALRRPVIGQRMQIRRY